MAAPETIDRIRNALQCGRAGCPCAAPNGKLHCPAHSDADPSLTVRESGGRVLVRCHAGCDQEAVIEALKERGLWPMPGQPLPPLRRSWRAYDAETGELRGEHVREDTPRGKRVWWEPKGIKTASLALYRAEVLALHPDRPAVLCEGEVAADALASIEEALGIVAMGTVTGASSTPGPAALGALAGRDVYLWKDADDPGERHMARIAERLEQLGITALGVDWPEAPPKGDAADAIAAGVDVRELLEGVHPFTHTNGTGGDVHRTEVLWSSNRHREPARHIIEQGLLQRGRLIAADSGRQAYYFEQETRRVMRVDSFDFGVLLGYVYHVNPAEGFFGYLLHEIKTEAAMHGQRAVVHYSSWYDEARNVVYMDCGAGQMLKLDGKRPALVDNGTDGVLFAAAPDFVPWTWIPNVAAGTLSRHLIWTIPFAEPIEASDFTIDEQRYLFAMWLLSLFFLGILRTKPIAAAVGPSHSGKSNLFRRVGMLVYGPEFEVDSLSRDGEKDFFVATSNLPFVAYDNADQWVPWLENALAQASTGQRRTTRALYTTNEAERYKGVSMIALTARTPKFRREDVASRLLIFTLQRLQEMRPEHQLIAELVANRDALMSDLARLVNQVLAVPQPAQQVAFVRLADFAVLATRIGTGLHIPAEMVDRIIAKMTGVQFKFALEEDELAWVLDQWLREPPAGQLDTGLPNLGREVSTTTLFRELRTLAERVGARFTFPNATSLGRHLQTMEEALGERFTVQRRHSREGNTWSFELLEGVEPLKATSTSYTVFARCGNCEWVGPVSILRRRRVREEPCPHCDCAELRALRTPVAWQWGLAIANGGTP